MPAPRNAFRVSVNDLTGNSDDFPLARVLAGLQEASEGKALQPESHPDNMRAIVDDIRSKTETDDQGNILGLRDKSIRSGFPTLDDRYGFLYPGLILLEGPHHSGKSAFAVQLAQQVRESNEDLPVFYFAYGDSKLDVQLRFVTRLARITKLDYIKGHFDFNALIKAGTKYLKFADGLYIVQGTRELTPVNLERLLISTLDAYYAARGRETPRENSCCVIVDYLQAVHSEEGSTPGDKVTYVAESLKDIVKKLQIPLVALYGNNMPEQEKTVTRTEDFQVVVEKRNNLDLVADIDLSLVPAVGRRDTAGAISAMNRKLGKDDRIPEDEGGVREFDVVVVKNKHGVEGTEEFWFAPGLSRWYCPADIEGAATSA